MQSERGIESLQKFGRAIFSAFVARTKKYLVCKKGEKMTVNFYITYE